MAKRTPAEQLNDAVEVVMTDGAPPAVDDNLAALLRLAAELRDLPRDDFRVRLKKDLEAHKPEGLSATPYLIVKDAGRALAFYKSAFGASELMEPMMGPGGKIMHAEIAIGAARLMIADESPEWGNLSPQSLGGSPVIIALQVADVDTLAAQAVDAGARVLIPVADQFYGERAGRLADPFGHIWIVSTHLEDVAPDELQRRMAELGGAGETGAADVPVVREGFRAITPYLQVHGAAEMIDFMQQAFGAHERLRINRPGGIAHAEVTIGDSVVELADASAEFPAMPTALHLYVEDADEVYARALRAGATSLQVPTDQDYGDREAGIRDRFGNNWYIATPLQRKAGVPGTAHVPAGLHAVTPYLHPHGAPALIDFMKQAFGAEEAFAARAPDGTVVHAKIRIADSIIEMGEAHGPYQPMPTAIHLYVPDVDEFYDRALRHGGTSLFAPADQDYGDRIAGVKDPGENWWYIATHKRDVSPQEMQVREDARARRETEDASSEAAAQVPVPAGFHAVTPLLLVREVAPVMQFLEQAFGAEETLLTVGGDPPHTHGEVRIGDSIIMLGDAAEPTSAALYVYVPDVDRAYQRALQAGAMSVSAPADKPYGDRAAAVKDPFGNTWWMATPRAKISR